MAAWLAFLEVSHRLDRVIEHQLRQDAGLSHAQYEIRAYAEGVYQLVREDLDRIGVRREAIVAGEI